MAVFDPEYKHTGLDRIGNIEQYLVNANGGSRTVRVTMPLASDNAATNTVGVTDFLERIPLMLPVTTTRWRLRIRNSRNTGGTIAGTMALTDVYVGLPAFDTSGVATGSFKAAPVRAVAASGQTFGDTEYVSGWVTDSSLQFAADTMAMLSFGWTNSNGQVITYNGSGNGPKTAGMVYTGTGASSSAGSTDPGGSALWGSLYGDVRVEYEAVTPLPVVLVVSDSTGVGWTDDTTKYGNIRAALGVSSWPAQAGMRERFMWANASVQGAKAADFITSTDNRYGRLDLATTVPDAAIINVGINDSGTAPSTWKQQYEQIISVLQGFGIERIYAATILPQPQFKPGVILAAATSAVSSLTTSIAYANGDVVDVDYSFGTYEQLTVSGASAADTKGAYTTSFTASTTQPHALGAIISATTESRRRDFNDWIRGGPGGIDGIFDFARATADPRYAINCADPLLWGSGTIHPGRAAYTEIARCVRIKRDTVVA